MRRFVLISILFISVTIGWAQQFQTVRGRVTDKESKTPLPGVNISGVNFRTAQRDHY